jgi:predicted NBD/HSP70 family sugar kinase
MLRERFDCPVTVDDSVTAATMAERWFGLGIGVDNFIALRVRTGMSLGIFAGGELYRGAGSSGTVNELYALSSHAAVKRGEARGLFRLGSGHAMLSRLRRRAGPKRSPQLWRLVGGNLDRLTLACFLEATRREDPLCVGVLTDASRTWGHALAHVYALLHPEKAIVCGAFSEFADLLRPPLQEAMDETIFPALRGKNTVEFSDLGSTSGALGAAALALGNAVRDR